MAISPINNRPIPRISANNLALYMVSSETARIGIIRRSKTPQIPPIIRYKDARHPIIAYLSDANRHVNPLISAEERFHQRAEDRSVGPLKQDDALKSIEVLHAIQGMANQLAAFDFHPAQTSQPKLIIGGVEVSLRADLIVHGTARGKEQVGAAIFRMTQDDAETDEARAKRQNMGLYVAVMARKHIEENIQSDREPTNRLCLSIDIQHGEVFPAPSASTRRSNDLESACRMIAAFWDQV